MGTIKNSNFLSLTDPKFHSIETILNKFFDLEKLVEMSLYISTK